MEVKSELTKKIDQALDTIDFFSPKTEPYYVCYSGGKDSDCIRLLCDMWGGDYELHNNHTTVDAPETVYYIREVMSQYGERKTVYEHGERIHVYGEKGFIHFPAMSMWQLIQKKGFPPMRVIRYCCSELKEKGGRGRRAMTGVRWAESSRRKDNQGKVVIIGKKKTIEKEARAKRIEHLSKSKNGIILNNDNEETRELVEDCYRQAKTLINPIIDWTDEDVWNFLKSKNCESNPLYKKGFRRIGCIGCPMSGPKGMKREFAIYPRYERLYIRTFDKMLSEGKKLGRSNKLGFKTGKEVFKWWGGDDPKQLTFEEYFENIGEEWI